MLPVGKDYLCSTFFLYLETDVGAVVEGVVALHEGLGGLEIPDVERVVGTLPGKAFF